MSKRAKKITVGVEKAYYAELIEDGDKPIYAPATYLQGLREFSIVANEESSSIYAENRLWDTESALGEIETTFDFTSIFTEDYVAILGKKLAKTGGIIESSNDQVPYIGMMLEKTLSGGVKEYLTLFKGKLRTPEDKGKTKEGTTEYQTSSLNGTFIPLNNGQWKHVVRSDDANFDPVEHAKTWGKKIVIPEELEYIVTSVATSTPTKDQQGVAITSTITLNFNNEIVDFDVELADAQGANVTVTNTLTGNNKILTVKPTTNMKATNKHTLLVTTKDIYGKMTTHTLSFTTA